jgi:predicted O-linked N-acetylglucosamine transferase (SPINDLY family)
MGHLSLQQFVADNEEDYVHQACHLANHIYALAQLRRSLRERFNQSNLTNPETLALGLEQVFRQMWKRWCVNKSAVAINLSQIGMSV